MHNAGAPRIGRKRMMVVPCHDLTPSEIDAIEDRLYAFNSMSTGRDDAAAFGFAVRGEAREAIAVIAGYTWAGIAEIRQFWVDPDRRGKGHGRALLNAALAEASNRGVKRIWVASYEFQAPSFYEKAGFVRKAALAEWPVGHTNVILCKTLE